MARHNLERLDYSFQLLDHHTERFRFLSGNAVKMIAIIIMFIDHFSKIVLEWMSHNIWWPAYNCGQMTLDEFNQIDYFVRFDLYAIGAIAFPLFCFLLAEGFYYTKDKRKYCCLMAIFAIASELPFDAAFFSYLSNRRGTFPFYWPYQNVFFTLFLGLIALWCIERFRSKSDAKIQKWKSRFLQIVCTVGIAEAADLIHSDYGSMGVLFIVGFYICRKNRLYQILMFLFLYMLTTGNQPTLPTGISCLVIALYNGKRGKWHMKYFFYAFYPLHITILYLITVWLSTELL